MNSLRKVKTIKLFGACITVECEDENEQEEKKLESSQCEISPVQKTKAEFANTDNSTIPNINANTNAGNVYITINNNNDISTLNRRLSTPEYVKTKKRGSHEWMEMFVRFAGLGNREPEPDLLQWIQHQHEKNKCGLLTHNEKSLLETAKFSFIHKTKSPIEKSIKLERCVRKDKGTKRTIIQDDEITYTIGNFRSSFPENDLLRYAYGYLQDCIDKTSRMSRVFPRITIFGLSRQSIQVRGFLAKELKLIEVLPKKGTRPAFPLETVGQVLDEFKKKYPSVTTPLYVPKVPRQSRKTNKSKENLSNYTGKRETQVSLTSQMKKHPAKMQRTRESDSPVLAKVQSAMDLEMLSPDDTEDEIYVGKNVEKFPNAIGMTKQYQDIIDLSAVELMRNFQETILKNLEIACIFSNKH